MSKRALQAVIDQRPAVRNGELVHAATVVQVSQLALNGPYRGDFQIIDQGRLIVGEHPDLGERVIAGSYGMFGYDPSGVNTFAVVSRQYGPFGAGDVFAGYTSGNYLLFDQSEGTLGVYSPAGAGFIAAADGSLYAGDTDGAHMRWNTATRAIEVRNGEDVKISLDANGDASFDGTVYASGGRIYGQMQVDGLFRAGDVDGPSISLGRFERTNDDDELVESSEIIATDANNLPWFHVVAGGGTAAGGYFYLGNPGDYQQRLIYDGTRLALDGDIYARGGEFSGDVVFGGGAGALGPNGLSIVSDGDATPETTNAVAWYDEASFTNRTGWIYGQTGTTEHNLTIETDGRVLDYTATTYLYARGGASKTGAVRMYAYGNDTDSNGGNIGIAATGAAGGATATVNADAVQITGNGYWKPASDSTTALQLQNAAGTPVVTVDTTNSRLVLGSAVPIMAGTDRLLHRYGTKNLFVGTNAGNFTQTGTGGNVGLGDGALLALTDGYYNVGIGQNALEDVTSGNGNIALGAFAGRNLTTGYGNIALGYFSLQAGTQTIYNIAIGAEAMSAYNPGSASGRNIAIGAAALGSLTSGVDNVVIGTTAGYSGNMSGAVYIGHGAGQYETVDNKLILDSQYRGGTEAGQRIGAPIYAEMNSTLTNQLVRVNGVLQSLMTDGATNAVTTQTRISHNTSGTVANGFGSAVLFELQSSSSTDRSAAAIKVLWNEKTDASRKADLVLVAYDTAEREVLRGRGTGSAPAIGFLGATPAARQAHVADPSGGSTIDAEARTAINSILATLETFGFHATS